MQGIYIQSNYNTTKNWYFGRNTTTFRLFCGYLWYKITFMFGWLKKKSAGENRPALGMIMLGDENTFIQQELFTDLFTRFNRQVTNPGSDANALTFEMEGELVAIMHMPFPIPAGDIEGTAKYAYNWQTVLDEVKDHKSHLIVTVIGNGKDQVKKYAVLTRVISSLLNVTNSIGVYKGNQSLLVNKTDYLAEAALMSDDYLPVNLWVYFGLQPGDRGNSGYTYGLKEFNKKEMEILHSSKDIFEIREFLFNMAHYVLDADVTFRNGQTCGLSENEKIKISVSKGEMTEGDTIKLAY